MSAVEFLISFVNARLSAAVDEIFTVFENTIVKYEQDIARQRRLLESFWKPEVKLRRIDLPELHVSTAQKVLPTKLLCNRNCSLDQEEPGPPQEQHQFLLSQEQPAFPQIKEQLELFGSQQLQTCSFRGTPVSEDCGEREPDCGEREPDCGEREPDCGEREPDCDQLLSHRPPNRSLEGHKDSGSAAAAERKPRRKRRRNQSDRNCHMSKSRNRAGKKVRKM